MKKIGFIGMGVMGRSMTRNLMKAGFEMHIFTRTKETATEIIDEGAIWHDSIANCVSECDAVITMVGFPQDVEEVYFAPGGILENAKIGTYLIDMTTTSPTLAIKIYNEGSSKGFHVLDAPVTGGDVGARNGTLSILVGGERADFEYCMLLFKAMGTTINYQGAAGFGQHAKMANQIMIAGTLSGLCEALAYSKAKGLDLQLLMDSVSGGAAGSKQLDLYAHRIIGGDYAPGFFLKHFNKDLALALEEAGQSGLSLDVLRKTLENAQTLEENGHGNDGSHVLMKFYER